MGSHGQVFVLHTHKYLFKRLERGLVMRQYRWHCCLTWRVGLRGHSLRDLNSGSPRFASWSAVEGPEEGDFPSYVALILPSSYRWTPLWCPPPPPVTTSPRRTHRQCSVLITDRPPQESASPAGLRQTPFLFILTTCLLPLSR